MEIIQQNLPFAQAIDKFSENFRETDGRLLEQDLNIDELNQLFTDVGISRQWIRSIALGHAVETYTNWVHLEEETGYSIWKYPVTNFADNDKNLMLMDNKPLVYKGCATSESDALFDKLIYYDGEEYTDVTDLGTEGELEVEILSNADCYMYVSRTTPFTGFACEFSQYGSGLTLEIEYYNGSEWKSVLTSDDETSGHSMNGKISFTTDVDFASATLDFGPYVGEVTGYFVRYRTNITPVAIPTIIQLSSQDGVPGLLAMNDDEVSNEQWSWCYFGGYVYVCIRNTGVPYYEGNYYLKSSSTAIQKQNFFVSYHSYKVHYENSTYVPTTIYMLSIATYTQETLPPQPAEPSKPCLVFMTDLCSYWGWDLTNQMWKALP